MEKFDIIRASDLYPKVEINRLLARALQTAPPEYVTGGKDLRSLGCYPAASVSLSDVCADNDGNCVMGSLTGEGFLEYIRFRGKR